MDELMRRTEGYSGSDLKEFCRNAAMLPVREAIRKYQGTLTEVEALRIQVRPLAISDFFPPSEIPGSTHVNSDTFVERLD
ncbi:hypothetical protein HK102_007739 [Quaeritorhiza haematococci]|nr:hypothetical protein HK102_007739 [Quaeritorhiza haematococci]